MRFSQRFPVKGAEQVQVKVVPRLEHTPLFRHGLASHGVARRSHLGPTQ